MLTNRRRDQSPEPFRFDDDVVVPVRCLVVLVRLGATETPSNVPNLSITVALVLALGAFALFAVFVSHIVGMLQPSSVIASILEDGREAIADAYPRGVAREPDDGVPAYRLAFDRTQQGPPRVVTAEREGYVSLVRGEAIVRTAKEANAIVLQVAPIGEYVLPGETLAEVWCEDGEQAVERIRAAFELGQQRTLVQDVAFPIRQLADIALKGLSPGVNDPTTAQNAVQSNRPSSRA